MDSSQIYANYTERWHRLTQMLAISTDFTNDIEIIIKKNKSK